MSFREWMQKQFDNDELKDIAQYGADAGWGGLTYYKDTCELYDRYQEEIWEALNEDADDFGYKSPHEVIASFNSKAYNETQHKNLLVWYMAERTARELVPDW